MSHKLLLAACCLLAACQQLPEPTPAASPATSALAALRVRYGAQPQYFSYNPQRVDVFRTAGGGALATGSQAFLTIAGNIPAPGPLQLEVREVRTRADMVLSGLPSMAQGAVLESGGHYLVQASTASHQLLWLSPQVKLGLAVSTSPRLSSPYGLAVYAPTQPGSPTGQWQPSADTASSVYPSTPLAATDPVYLRCLIGKGLYDSNSGWLSFARPLYTPYPPATVRVHLSEAAAAADNSAVYLVFRDYNAVAQLTPLGQGDYELANVPGQAAITVFALYGAGPKLYLGQQADTVRAGQRLLVPLHEHTAEEVAAAARLLD